MTNETRGEIGTAHETLKQEKDATEKDVQA